MKLNHDNDLFTWQTLNYYWAKHFLPVLFEKTVYGNRHECFKLYVIMKFYNIHYAQLCVKKMYLHVFIIVFFINNLYINHNQRNWVPCQKCCIFRTQPSVTSPTLDFRALFIRLHNALNREKETFVISWHSFIIYLQW